MLDSYAIHCFAIFRGYRLWTIENSRCSYFILVQLVKGIWRFGHGDFATRIETKLIHLLNYFRESWFYEILKNVLQIYLNVNRMCPLK